MGSIADLLGDQLRAGLAQLVDPDASDEAPGAAPASSDSTVETAQDLPVSVPEEIAFENGWVSRERLLECAERYGKSDYGRHLRDVAEGRIVPGGE